MNGSTQNQDHQQNFARKSPGTDHSAMLQILLIGRDQNARLYTDEVLRRGGFSVRAIAPWEAKNVVADGVDKYPLVIFSNTLNTQDISEIGTQLRRSCPGTKLLLMLGPDSAPVNNSLFDAMLEGLEGPVALIRAVRYLAEASMADGAARIPA